MAPANNWLSFSLSPMEMLRSSSSSPESHFLPYDATATPAVSAAPSHYLIDNFYNNGIFFYFVKKK